MRARIVWLALALALVGLYGLRRWWRSPERWAPRPAPIEELGPGAGRTPAPTFAATTFPLGETWPTVDPAEAGWDPDRLARAVAIARELGTVELLLVYQGRILAEHSWPIDPDDLPEPPRRTFERIHVGHADDGQPLLNTTSIQKGVLALLVAMALDRGLIDLDDSLESRLPPQTAIRPPQHGAPITLRHVLTMTTGLSMTLEYDAPPGSVWAYNPRTPLWLLPAVASAAGLDRDELLAQWLAEPLGLEHTAWLPEPPPVRLSLISTPRDLARIGLLIQSGGRFGDRRLIEEETLRALGRPSQAENPAYGLLWWLNRPDSLHSGGVRDPERPLPDAPHDLWIAIGTQMAQLAISPGEQIVFVRFGLKTEMKPQMNSIWREILAARPAQPR